LEDNRTIQQEEDTDDVLSFRLEFRTLFLRPFNNFGSGRVDD